MNTKQYITAITYIILLRVVDLGLTFVYTPNLKYEWNPVVSIFSYSWIGMLITQILVVGLIDCCYVILFFKKPLANLPDDLSFRRLYLLTTFHNQKRSQEKQWLKYNRMTINTSTGLQWFILMTMAISISYLAIINNLMIIYMVKSYSRFITQYGSVLLHFNINHDGNFIIYIILCDGI